MTQDELIAAALEEEERNRASLRDWVRREEERRELRRVGRKRVRGPRWTFISRTVGSLVEEIKPAPVEPVNAEPKAQVPNLESQPDKENVDGSLEPQRMVSDTPTTANVQDQRPAAVASLTKVGDEAANFAASDEGSASATPLIKVEEDPANTALPVVNVPSRPKDSSSFEIEDASEVSPPKPSVTSQIATIKPITGPAPTTTVEKHAVATPQEPDSPPPPQQYARNYLILSQIAGGLPEELKLILGDHIEWDHMKYIPHKGRPISKLIMSVYFGIAAYVSADRRPTISPFTGRPAKYRHPETSIPYSSVAEFRHIQALLAHRYVWSEELGCWLGGEEDVPADGAADIPGWREAVHGGWFGAKEIPAPLPPDEVVSEQAEVVDEAMEVDEKPAVEVLPSSKKKGKRKSVAPDSSSPAKGKPSKKGKKPRQTM